MFLGMAESMLMAVGVVSMMVPAAEGPRFFTAERV